MVFLFLSADGSRGVVGGPHKSFTEVHKHLNRNHASVTTYFTERMQEYCNDYWLGVDINLLDIKECEITFDDVVKSTLKTNPQRNVSSITLVNTIFLLGTKTFFLG